MGGIDNFAMWRRAGAYWDVCDVLWQWTISGGDVEVKGDDGVEWRATGGVGCWVG